MRVLRLIARMNVGGPAHHVALLSGRLDPERYDTLLACGTVGTAEASAEHLAAAHGVEVHHIPGLMPEVRPDRDMLALASVAALIRRFRPHIVHTHTAKAGFIGRAAAAARPADRRPVIVHTFHGHVLEGYFGPAKTEVYRGLERRLAAISDKLVGVSATTVDDLVRLGVAPRERFAVVPVGLALERFLAVTPELRVTARTELGMAPDDVVATMVGRLVPIKRVDVALRGLAEARRTGARLRLVIAGDGEERPALERLVDQLQLREAVLFLGFRDDPERLAAASDFALLTSDNEGTPVALIEAAAAGRPAVATDVGGVADVIAAGAGRLVPPDDPIALGAALAELTAATAERRSAMGTVAREHVSERFGADRLVRDVDALYQELLAQRSG